jgi:hypothetical protein
MSVQYETGEHGEPIIVIVRMNTADRRKKARWFSAEQRPDPDLVVQTTSPIHFRQFG